METIELFKIIGKRVTKLPPAQQEDIIETMLGLIDATERMNRSAAFGCGPQQQQQNQQWNGYSEPTGGFNLTKSVSSFALTGTGFGPMSGSVGSGMDVELGALTSSPSNLL